MNAASPSGEAMYVFPPLRDVGAGETHMPETIVSIDAHKDSCTYIVKEDREVLQDATRIPSTKTALTGLAKAHPDATFLMEASGVHEWIHDHLVDHGCNVVIGHPIKREQNDGKSDGEDALRYVGRFQVGEIDQVHLAEPEVRRTRDVVRQRNGLKAEKTRLTNRLKSTLARTGYYAEDNPAPLTQKGRDHVTTLRPELGPLYELVDELDEHIDVLEGKVKDHAKGVPEVKRLKRIPGIGTLTALSLHVEIHDIDRFPNAEALVSYFGLDPEVEQSGDERWHKHQISKRGRGYIRGLLNQAAWSHVNTTPDSSLTATFHRLRKRKGKKIAVVATARRLLKVAYHVLNDDRDFQVTPPSGL